MTTMLEASQENLCFVLEKAGSVRFEHRPIPTIGPRDVLVSVEYTGICGSDVHYWNHGAIGDFVVKKPMVLGHESSGVVVATGTHVTDLRVGSRVALEPGSSCRVCNRCKEGRYNLCRQMRFAATPPVDGTLAKYYALPADFCYELGDHVTLEEGAVVEPLSIAVHVVRQANIKPGQSLVVFGAGPVGLLCCAVARRAYGASCVIAVDTNQERLAFARKYAATQTYKASGSSPEDTAAAILAECHTGSGVDAAIDASGAESCIQTAMHVLRTGGAYVQAGLGRQMISFPIGSVCSKELSIKGSFRYGPGDYELAVRLLNNGQVSVRELITDCFSFHESEKAFESVKAARGMKTLIRGPGQPLSSKFGRERARL